MDKLFHRFWSYFGLILEFRCYNRSTTSTSHDLFRVILIDLFTDTAAILNLLDLRSIMGCPGGTRSVLTRAFPAKIELHCIFLGKKAMIIKSKQGTTIFFPITIFF